LAVARCATAIVEAHPAVFARHGRTLEEFLALAEDAGLALAERRADVLAFVRGT
jgi:hypothetical protein